MVLKYQYHHPSSGIQSEPLKPEKECTGLGLEMNAGSIDGIIIYCQHCPPLGKGSAENLWEHCESVLNSVLLNCNLKSSLIGHECHVTRIQVLPWASLLQWLIRVQLGKDVLLNPAEGSSCRNHLARLNYSLFCSLFAPGAQVLQQNSNQL